MNGSDMDRHSAAAESRLDAIDDGPDGAPVGNGSVELAEGMHIETDPSELAAEDSDDEGHVEVDHAALVDEVGEAFNARDLDALAELCADDCETSGLAGDMSELHTAIADLWERRPTVTMTRAVDDLGVAVGVVWERGETAAWAPLGVCHVDVDGDGLAVVLEFSDDVGLLDQLELDPPDGELDEGARWEEWEQGVE